MNTIVTNFHEVSEIVDVSAQQEEIVKEIEYKCGGNMTQINH